MSSLGLLVLSLGLGQAFDGPEWTLAPQYAPGLELVYRGTCTDQSLVPGVQHQRQYDVEMILLMQKIEANFGNAVLQTSLTVREPRNLAAKDNAPAPGSVRLQLVQIDRRGGLRLRQNARAGRDAFDDTDLAVPLDGPPVVETGAFFQMPVVPVHRLSYWEEQEDRRPLRGWHVFTTRENPTGIERCLGVPCVKLQWEQQSPDWKVKRADSTAWRRQDVIWFSYQAGQVFRVKRTIERRDPGRMEPTRHIMTDYELTSRFQYTGQLLDDRNGEIARVVKFQEEAAPFLRQPAQFRANIDSLLGRIAEFTAGRPANPYRKAMLHLKSKLERARTGEMPVSRRPADPALDEVQPLGIGDKVPDFVIAELTARTENNTHHFHEFLGQPILMLYYNPTTPLGKEVLQFAENLCDKYGPDLLVLGMAVSDDVRLVRNQFEEMDLSFPILDGKAMIRTFGVDGTPRVVLLDADGLVRWAFTGWGYHSPAEVAREVGNLMPKKSKN